jgi:SAM-dependent methyltransferase
MVNWFDSVLGIALHEAEEGVISTILPARYYDVVVDVGPGRKSAFSGIQSERRVSLTPPSTACLPVGVTARLEQLPLVARTVDLVLLRHSLDFAVDPRHALREVVEIMAPEGLVVICGFNLLGLWGGAKIIRRTKQAPWNGRYLSLGRLHDWLSLLQLNVVGGRTCFYRPPLQSAQWLEGLSFMEAMGNRWWPLWGGAYVVVARKRSASARLMPVKAQFPRGADGRKFAVVGGSQKHSGVVVNCVRRGWTKGP